jgi:farnesyl-diphosphate farnesyltransferase
LPDVLLPQDELAHLLARTSRTFALAIPLLEPPLARQVGVAYLLFRMADELEDAPLWTRDRRLAALRSFASWLEPHREEGESLWQRLVHDFPPTTAQGCLELFSRAPGVRSAVLRLAPGDMQSRGAATAIVTHARRTALGMADFVARQDERGGLMLADLPDLRAYCYAVAGIVGEVLTDLFVLAAPRVAGIRGVLDAHAGAFGEGLQLVNILKDAKADSCAGRAYLPAHVSRREVVDLARSDLAQAVRYVNALGAAEAPPGMIAFCDLPLRLAEATLDALDRGEPKLDRDRVMNIYRAVATRTVVA